MRGGVNLENLFNYSTDETPIGTWINGDTIYRKVIDCGTMPNAGTKNVPHKIANVDKWVNIKGVFYSANKTASNIPSVTPYSEYTAYQVGMDVDAENIIITTGTDRRAYIAIVILEYTKNE